MKAIVSAFSDREKPLSIRDIQKSSKACYFDTSEVTRMISYITSFGKVFTKEGKWIRVAEKEKKPSKPGRSHYLDELLKIISVLSIDSPKTEVEIVQETGLDIEKVKEVLPFLADITGRGYIIADGNRFAGTFKLLQLKSDNN
jgi:hypothetical protein